MSTYTPKTIILNRYRIEKFIGAGAFAEVYLVTHLALNARYALKILNKASGIGSTLFADYVQRFRLEAQLGAALDSPYIVRVHDFEQEGDLLIQRMSYAAGGSLAQRLDAIRRKVAPPLPIEEAVRITREVALGLAALHELDAVHRDVKPSNILFTEDGRAMLADLGLAQAPGGPSLRSQLSEATPHPGTPAYMSPEQARPPFAHLTPSSDIYSLGAVLFEMLTTRLYKNVRPGTSVTKLRPDAPAWLADLLGRMLDETPANRPWDGAELAELLDEGKREQEAAQMWTEEERRRQEIEEAERQRQALLRRLKVPETVKVPAGEFLMGSDKKKDPDAWNDETPQHRVYLDAFEIAKYPVTVAQFEVFVKETGYRTTAEKEGSGFVWTDNRWKEIKGADWRHPHGPDSDVRKKADHPVTQVSWYDAVAYCQWLSEKTGQNWRLPTEAEWEKAARGADGRIYPWGNKPPDKTRCNFNRNVGDTTPVGQYSAGASPYGALDMAGNVWEWVADWFDSDYYKHAPNRNPTGPSSGHRRVLRGGSWNFNPSGVRAAYRSGDLPVYRHDGTGFRCLVPS